MQANGGELDVCLKVLHLLQIVFILMQEGDMD